MPNTALIPYVHPSTRFWAGSGFCNLAHYNQAKTAEALATIERNAKLQAKLIEDLLDVSRILRDRLTLKMIPIDLEYCISGALDTVRLAAQAKEIDIQTVFDPDELVAAVARLHIFPFN